MTPKQITRAVDILMKDSERVTDAVLQLVDHAHENGLCLAITLGWVNRLFASIETRLAHQLMGIDDEEDEILEPAIFPIKTSADPSRN